jgi:hypothetical protein
MDDCDSVSPFAMPYITDSLARKISQRLKGKLLEQFDAQIKSDIVQSLALE